MCLFVHACVCASVCAKGNIIDYDAFILVPILYNKIRENRKKSKSKVTMVFLDNVWLPPILTFILQFSVIK